MTAADRQCGACLAGAAAGAPVPVRVATHEEWYANKFGEREVFCPTHAMPGDVPIAGAVAEVRRRVWGTDSDETKGY